ncbi:hypothetical protein GCM10010266_23170 [Streptomyces griseomycini]|nr:hypothetical protein GCM10010266_23170 [Streptomyces griseomycini]
MVAALREELTGGVPAPGDPGCDEDRTVFDAMIDRRPAVIARCARGRRGAGRALRQGAGPARVPGALPGRTVGVRPFGVREDADDDERRIGWVRDVRADVRPWGTGAVCLDSVGDEGADRVEAGLGGENTRRPAEPKRRYAPDHVFRFDHGIRPAPGARAPHAGRGVRHRLARVPSGP